MDKTGKKYWSSKPYFAHIYILYIGAQLGYGKAERYSFLKNIEKYLTSPAQNSTFANVIRNTTQKEKHKVLTKSKKRKENTLWRTGNGVSATRILNFEL